MATEQIEKMKQRIFQKFNAMQKPDIIMHVDQLLKMVTDDELRKQYTNKPMQVMRDWFKQVMTKEETAEPAMANLKKLEVGDKVVL